MQNRFACSKTQLRGCIESAIQRKSLKPKKDFANHLEKGIDMHADRDIFSVLNKQETGQAVIPLCLSGFLFHRAAVPIFKTTPSTFSLHA
jgi:hypothetical protein